MLCAANSLQNLLSSQDAVLGPQVPGRDPLLDALNTFVGTPGSPALRAWEQGLPNPTDPAGQLTGACFILVAADQLAPQHSGIWLQGMQLYIAHINVHGMPHDGGFAHSTQNFTCNMADRVSTRVVSNSGCVPAWIRPHT